MSVNEKMTAIANAIRAKTGNTEPLGLDAMAQAIAALEIGGGAELPDWISEINFGTFSYTESKSGYNVSVEHGLSGKPVGFLVYLGPLTSNPGTDYINAVYGHSGTIYNSSSGGSLSGSSLILKGLSGTTVANFSADSTRFTLFESNSYTYKIQRNTTYYWIAWR